VQPQHAREKNNERQRVENHAYFAARVAMGSADAPYASFRRVSAS
jgi:hypothetical protein